MKKFSYMDATALVVWLLPIIYLYSIYSSLPEIVPVHYGIGGKVDRYGNKSELIMLTGIMLFVGALVYLLLKFLPAIDPKNKVKYGEETFRKIAFGVMLFLSALNVAILYVTVHRNLPIDKIILPIAGLLFTFMGNMMNNIKPNYFAGVRTPWTLESEDTWRATHRLAAKLWFAGGLVITAATLVLPSASATVVFIAGLMALTLIPVIYSYVYFKNHQPEKKS
ncbi:SdpI family protein [Mucilaginibacter sp. L3T2-6]|uniref:SdpI family protein n=1 Tax=Mucilaginibacter sp. L3T2-6 TaxID=3062491 RepID=UPI002676929E|nr:SdpI family protein [Mucilaginibacter sp. L3T2-6]MDO3644777.1 SdpI family protein [Mucilaginibacter sp. L3T2-6]MDV6217187.1 SdpI family protein [Mucilaginibacter sp. L3T2-6]